VLLFVPLLWQALVRILGSNALRHSEFEDEVKMWVFEEQVNGRKLTDIINTEHENVKYLPGAKFTPNVRAVSDLAEVVKGADLLAFCLPHQFLSKALPVVKANAKKGVIGLSAIKGIDFDDKGIVLISEAIRNTVGCDTSILMGANVAKEMGKDQFCETTIGYSNAANGEKWKLVRACVWMLAALRSSSNSNKPCSSQAAAAAAAAAGCGAAWPFDGSLHFW
jgi:glycerol-3-phosphate dehydrogenase (NAD+)